jgi:hypothetical protein
MKDIHRGEVHPVLLVEIKSLAEWLPCIGELLKAGASFRQGLSTYPHDLDWIEFTLTGPLGQLSKRFNPMVARLGSGTDGVLYSRPKFCLLWCELQHIFGGSNSRIG